LSASQKRKRRRRKRFLTQNERGRESSAKKKNKNGKKTLTIQKGMYLSTERNLGGCGEKKKRGACLYH